MTRDGVRLDGAFQRAERAASTPNIDACCLVHGTGSNFYGSTLLAELGQRLLSLGVSVLRVNTRGHDGISIAATARGGQRLGAAYERVADCRHDLAAWSSWLVQHAGPRLGWIGHSLGAVKCLYALVHEADLPASGVVALSPPRLSYAWFCQSEKRAVFLDDYNRALSLVQAGEPVVPLEVSFPLPMIITAVGYTEKYGPDESYNYLSWTERLACPALFLFGSQEVENQVPFQHAPQAIAALAERNQRLHVETIAGGDHFYTGVREPALERITTWLRQVI